MMRLTNCQETVQTKYKKIRIRGKCRKLKKIMTIIIITITMIRAEGAEALMP